MTDHADLVAELRGSAAPRASLMRDAADAIEAWVAECHQAWRDRSEWERIADEALTDWEYSVRTHFAPLNRTIQSQSMDEETARALITDTLEHTERTLLRRRSAGEWETVPE